MALTGSTSHRFTGFLSRFLAFLERQISARATPNAGKIRAAPAIQRWGRWLASQPSTSEAMGLVPAQQMAHRAMTLAAFAGRSRMS